MVRAAGLGHIGGEFSVIDILVTLYLHALNTSPEQLGDPERDRFILSKGHAAAALYTTLAVAGFLPPDELSTFMQPQSALNGHPARTKIAAVEASTGPLGHGLPIAVGTAFAGKLDSSARRTFVVVGDGELQEGSNWEALMTAGNHQLSHLCVIVDRNRLQQGARVDQTNDLEPLGDKLAAFGMEVVDVDGHDHGALLDVFADVPAPSGRPTAVIAHTMKGHPISFMSDNVAWHHKVPSPDELTQALAELETS
jgi:transketolase